MGDAWILGLRNPHAVSTRFQRGLPRWATHVAAVGFGLPARQWVRATTASIPSEGGLPLPSLTERAAPCTTHRAIASEITMPSAAQKQRRRKLKQKKENKKEDRKWWRGQQERLAAAVVRASDEWGPHPDECSPSERAHFRHFIYLLYNAFEEIAWDLSTYEHLDEEEVKEELEVMIHEVTTFTGDMQIEDIEKYAGFISHATAV